MIATDKSLHNVISTGGVFSRSLVAAVYAQAG
jgi:hypothetical protein